MDKRKWKSFRISQIVNFLAGPAVVVIIVMLLLNGLTNVASVNDTEGQRLLEESLQRSVVNCYAIEGAYPPTLDYLKEHYGITSR